MGIIKSVRMYIKGWERMKDCARAGLCSVVLGGFHEDWHRSRPLVVTYVRPGGPADR